MDTTPSEERASSPKTDTRSESADAQSSAPSGGAPQEMGKMLVPDLSAIASGQSVNIQAMTSVTKEATQSLQTIVASQQSILQSALQNLHVSLQDESGNAGMPSGRVPDLQPLIENMMSSVENFNASAETLVLSATKNFTTLTQAATESLAKIEEVAVKFSGG